MSINFKNWIALRAAVDWTARRNWWELLLLLYGFPILIGVLTNLWTGASSDQAAIPGWTLLVVAIANIVFGALVLAGDRSFPVLRVVDAIELENDLSEARDDCQQLRRELERRTEAHKAVRSAFEVCNSQMCFVDKEPWCKGGYECELLPVFRSLSTAMRTTFGVTAEQYTFEVHIKPDSLAPCEHELDVHNGLHLACFFSPQQVERVAPLALANESPARLGLVRNVPGIHRIDADKPLFYQGHDPKPQVYFRSYATVPLREVCSENTIGVLVLTSMQQDPFADDLLDNLNYLSSLISNFTYAFNQCIDNRSIYQEYTKDEEFVGSESLGDCKS
jgi:hypothetical protein